MNNCAGERRHLCDGTLRCACAPAGTCADGRHWSLASLNDGGDAEECESHGDSYFAEVCFVYHIFLGFGSRSGVCGKVISETRDYINAGGRVIDLRPHSEFPSIQILVSWFSQLASVGWRIGLSKRIGPPPTMRSHSPKTLILCAGGSPGWRRCLFG